MKESNSKWDPQRVKKDYLLFVDKISSLYKHKS